MFHDGSSDSGPAVVLDDLRPLEQVLDCGQLVVAVTHSQGIVLEKYYDAGVLVRLVRDSLPDDFRIRSVEPLAELLALEYRPRLRIERLVVLLARSLARDYVCPLS